MAAPSESIAFCKIVNEPSFLDVSVGHEDDSVIVTNNRRSCNIHKVNIFVLHIFQESSNFVITFRDIPLVLTEFDTRAGDNTGLTTTLVHDRKKSQIYQVCLMI